jgi:hypothetical protein
MAFFKEVDTASSVTSSFSSSLIAGRSSLSGFSFANCSTYKSRNALGDQGEYYRIAVAKISLLQHRPWSALLLNANGAVANVFVVLIQSQTVFNHMLIGLKPFYPKKRKT